MSSYVSEILIPTKMGLVSSIKWLVDHKYKFMKGSLKGDFYRFKQKDCFPSSMSDKIELKSQHLLADKVSSYKILENGIIMVMYELI